eukprot:Nk52_evm18s265 gene=Nk52_evmTU18s265
MTGVGGKESGEEEFVNGETFSKLCQLQEKKLELEKELDRRHSVSAEVKRLVVASVGDELGNTLEELIEDKHRLAQEAREWQTRSLFNAEQLDKLTIDLDILKSKETAAGIHIKNLVKENEELKCKLKKNEISMEHSVEKDRVVHHEICDLNEQILNLLLLNFAALRENTAQQSGTSAWEKPTHEQLLPVIWHLKKGCGKMDSEENILELLNLSRELCRALNFAQGYGCMEEMKTSFPSRRSSLQASVKLSDTGNTCEKCEHLSNPKEDSGDHTTTCNFEKLKCCRGCNGELKTV